LTPPDLFELVKNDFLMEKYGSEWEMIDSLPNKMWNGVYLKNNNNNKKS